MPAIAHLKEGAIDLEDLRLVSGAGRRASSSFFHLGTTFCSGQRLARGFALAHLGSDVVGREDIGVDHGVDCGNTW